MNKVEGKIKTIQVQAKLSLLTVEVDTILIEVVVIDTPETSTYLKVGCPIQLMFKEIEVIIGKGNERSNSLENKINGTLKSIQHGDLFSKIIVATAIGELTSIISFHMAIELELKPEDKIIAMIKSTDIMLSA